MPDKVHWAGTPRIAGKTATGKNWWSLQIFRRHWGKEMQTHYFSTRKAARAFKRMWEKKG